MQRVTTTPPGASRATRRLAIFLWALAGVAPAMAADEPDAAPRDLLDAYVADQAAFTLVDARSPAEYAAAHIEGAINVPYDADVDYDAILPADRDATVVVYCRSGRRAGLLRERLVDGGYTQVHVLDEEQTLWLQRQTANDAKPPASAQDPGDRD